ncbi:hypothetical protein E5358_14160 [Palleniella muris]|uniref:Uncharacterized protein n=1 Tax=Palleniella muris TaxID=3038145 RepID=A0AC61QLX0_9BACT|nr:DUF5074 domain-containing protein [Palleniella muris]TGX79937.1 hypothetical protein E5358_14160 [Palleniella muris]
MKKFFYLLAAVFALTACNTGSDYEWEGGSYYLTEGVFIVQEGNFGNVNGSIGYLTYNYIDINQWTMNPDIYFSANGTSLKGTINDAAICGNKIYIVGTDEKTIFVADKTSMVEVDRIKLELEGNTFKPRHIVVSNNELFVSTFEKKVFVINSANNTITKTYDCGSYSEGLAIADGYLYVANSNYASGENSSISKINLATGTSEEIKTPEMKNVVDVQTAMGRIFYLDSGTYDPVPPHTQKDYGIYELKGKNSVLVLAATEMCISGNVILGINNPHSYPSTGTPEFFAYNISSGRKNMLTDGKDISHLEPNKISLDPVSGLVYITCLSKNAGIPQYQDYGFCAVYGLNADSFANTLTGNYLKTFQCGVGPTYVIPNIKYVQK